MFLISKVRYLALGAVILIAIGLFSPVGANEQAQLYASMVCGKAGNVVTVEGAGFSPSSLVHITWSGVSLGTDPTLVQADPTGRIAFSFIVPNDHDGAHPVQVSDGTHAADFVFNLGIDCPAPATATPTAATATPTWTPTPIPPTSLPEMPRLFCPDTMIPDETVQISGENFHPGGHFYQLRWDGVVIPWSPPGLTIGNDGKFTLSFIALSDDYGIHTLVADDGKNGMAVCYANLVPRNPTPTSTASPTPTYSPTPTSTAGPPPGITVTPTAIPGVHDYCADIEAAFTRYPTVNGQIDAGIELTNTNIPWGSNELQVRIWQYYNMFAWDTGTYSYLPAMNQGETTTLHLSFESPQSGPTWFQVRLRKGPDGPESFCTSAWYPLVVMPAEPGQPALLAPLDDTWLNSKEVTLRWSSPEVPEGAGSVEQYEAQLVDVLGGGNLIYQATGPNDMELSHSLAGDYAARQLAWRVRARNSTGWGLWSTALYFGVDTSRPTTEISLDGQLGGEGWWISPVTVRVGGADTGSGLQATFMQFGEEKWQQVIPGGTNVIEDEGSFDVRAYSRDGAANRSSVVVQPVAIDLNPPYLIEAKFSAEPTSSGWYTRPLTVSVEAKDLASGVAARAIRLDAGPWLADVITLSETGEHVVDLIAEDKVGHRTDIVQTTAKLDLDPPVGALSINGSFCQACNPATITISVGDTESGIGHWTLSTIPQNSSQNPTVLASGNDLIRNVSLNGSKLPAGIVTLRLVVQDVAGWTTTTELVANNAAQTPGATPTPWIMPTSTPWPQPTTSASPTAVTAGREDEDDDDDDDDDNDSGGGSGGGSSVPSGYPVGGQVVPVVLPVTGGSVWSPCLISFVLLGGGGICLRRIIKKRLTTR